MPRRGVSLPVQYTLGFFTDLGIPCLPLRLAASTRTLCLMDSFHSAYVIRSFPYQMLIQQPKWLCCYNERAMDEGIGIWFWFSPVPSTLSLPDRQGGSPRPIYNWYLSSLPVPKAGETKNFYSGIGIVWSYPQLGLMAWPLVKHRYKFIKHLEGTHCPGVIVRWRFPAI